MIPETLKDVMKHEGVVAIGTTGKDGIHMVNTWNSYLRISPDGNLLIPVGHMRKTEANLAHNPTVLLTLGTREVKGAHGPGTGFMIKGKGEFVTSGSDFDAMKAQFVWARAVLRVKVESATQTL
jgi:roadblock/LC7 domain-containing protein